jgi:hypothetical protein
VQDVYGRRYGLEETIVSDARWQMTKDERDGRLYACIVEVDVCVMTATVPGEESNGRPKVSETTTGETDELPLRRCC